MWSFDLINGMLITFSHCTKKYHTSILGLIVVSMILIMSQINIHSLMLQQKMQHQSTSTLELKQTDLQQAKAVGQHCAQSTSDITSQSIGSLSTGPQCQSFISIADSLGTSSNLSITFPDFSAITFFIPLSESISSQNNDYQRSVYHLLIKTLFPTILIKLHSFLI